MISGDQVKRLADITSVSFVICTSAFCCFAGRRYSKDPSKYKDKFTPGEWPHLLGASGCIWLSMLQENEGRAEQREALGRAYRRACGMALGKGGDVCNYIYIT